MMLRDEAGVWFEAEGGVGMKEPRRLADAEAERQARLEREAQALRANLRRRKEQLRGRDAAKEEADTPETITDRNEQ